MNIFKYIIPIFCILLLSGSAFAQDACTDELQEQLDTCIEDAKTSCQDSVPECEPTALTPEGALALLAERCGTCTDARNFGKYNSCLKRTRNAIRKLRALTDEVKDALKTARTECKAEKKGPSDDDDSSDDTDDSTDDADA